MDDLLERRAVQFALRFVYSLFFAVLLGGAAFWVTGLASVFHGGAFLVVGWTAVTFGIPAWVWAIAWAGVWFVAAWKTYDKLWQPYY